MIIWWHVITFRLYPNDNLILQKSMSILPYMLMVNMLIFIYYFQILKGGK